MSFTADLNEIIEENRNGLLGTHPSWCRVPLGDIAEVLNGFPFDSKQFSRTSGHPLIRIRDVVGGHTNTFYNGEAPYDFWIEAGEILVGMDGDFNVARWKSQKALLNQRVLRIKSRDKGLFNEDFIFHLIGGYLQAINENTSSVTVKHLSSKTVLSIPLPLPPIAEQTRIAQKNDELLAQVDILKARIDAIPTILKHFRQSVLSAAVSGRLTEEWRASATPKMSAQDLYIRLKEAHEAEGGHARGNASEPTEEAHDLCADDLPSDWSIAELRDICPPGRPITYGILKPGPELDEGIPYIRVADFPGNKLNIESIKKTSHEIDLQYKRARLFPGDLLLSIRGSVGRLIKIPAILKGANITQDTARLSISPLMSTDYVYWALLANSTQLRMKNATRGVAVRGINIGDVRALQIPLPSIEEQIEIVHRVERFFNFADRLEARVAAAQARVDRLPHSILAKAFRGELTADWRDANPDLINGENSADALLKRIKAESEDHIKQPKKRRSSATKNTGQHMSKGIITVTEALEAANKPLTGQQLMVAAGYPNDSSTEQLESFFLDIREALEQQSIVKLSRDNNHQDWFVLSDNQ